MSTETRDAEPVLSIMREVGERTIEQARDAYSRCATFGEQTHNTLDDWSRRAWSGAREVSYRALSFADENAQRGFEHAEHLVKAKDLGEFVSLQHDHLGEQARRTVEQVRELGELSARIVRTMAEASATDWSGDRSSTDVRG